jgi:dihydrofolate reductase
VIAPRGIALVAALDRCRAIGRGNALPWHLPDDLKRFKALTLGRTVLMGRRTAESLGKPLPKRRNLVLTRARDATLPGMEVVHGLDEALAADPQLVVIGGGEVYALALPFAQRMHLTHVDVAIDGADAYFPRWDDCAWQATARERHAADAKHAYAFEFVDYERVG